MPRTAVLAAVLAAFAALAPAGASAAPLTEAASFDCAKAATALEREICRTADSRKADREMAAAYAKALALFPEPFRPALRATQRDFLAFVEPVCRIPGASPGHFSPDCLAGQFRERASTLDPNVLFQTSGGLTFLTLTSYRAVTAKTADPADGEPQADTLKVYLVQIARPANSAEQRWNAMIAERLTRYQSQMLPRSGAGMGQMSFEVDLMAVAPGLIDSSVGVSVTPQAGQHVSSHWSLTLGRELTAADLFVDPKAAAAFIAGLGLEEMLREDAGDGKPPNRARMLREILAAAARPANWTLAPDGFSLYLEDFGAHGASVTVPWPKLRPYLRRDLPFDLAKLS